VVGRWALDVLDAVLEPWQQHRQGALDRKGLLTAVRAQQEKLQTPLRWGAEHGTRPTRLCTHLLDRWTALWTWLEVEDGDSTTTRRKGRCAQRCSGVRVASGTSPTWASSM